MTEARKNKGKILVFSPWYPPHIGGLESHAHEFNMELLERKYEVLVLTPRSKVGGENHEVLSANMTIIRFPVFELIAEYPIPAFWHPHWWSAWWTAQRWHAHLIISRTRFFSTTILAWWYHRRTRTPWLHIEHGADYVHMDHPWAKKAAYYYDRLISRHLLNRAPALVANSKASAAFITTLTGRTDVTTIYRGVAHQKIAAITPYRARTQEKVLIIYSGRLIEGKGVAILLQALAALQNEPIQCSIIGGGPQQKELVDLTKTLGLTNIVTFFSQLAWPDTIAHMKAADIFVNPSYSEGLPTAVIEAALCQTAIIATNVGGTPEIITHKLSGFLIPPGDVTALEEALSQLIHHQALRQHLAERAYQEVHQKFKWSASMTHYESLFNKLIQA